MIGRLQGHFSSFVARFAQGAKARQRRRAAELLKRSGLVDRSWYLTTYPDVESRGIDPLLHYLEFGWKEGRDPGPRFSTVAYLRANEDVASIGVNPLLHYVEYGHSEGRGAPEHGSPAPAQPRPRDAFGHAAPCVSFAPDEVHVLRWKRANEKAGEQSFVLDGYFVCDCPDEESTAKLSHALAWLAALSGIGEPPAADADEQAAPVLVDAWHSAGLLRTRWRLSGGEPLVVRALQHVDEGPALVGEALVLDDLDCVDVVPKNAFFPVLFLFADTTGALVGSRSLGFPSLCRGGPHYPELILLTRRCRDSDQALSPSSVMQRLEAQMLAIRTGTRPLIGEIELDLAGADGSHPMFREDLRNWLMTTASVSVRPAPSDDGGSPSWLAQAVRLDAGDRTREGGAILRIASDMVPAISLLVAPADNEHRPSNCVSVIAADDDPARASVFLQLPRRIPEGARAQFAVSFPSLVGSDGSMLDVDLVPLAALRVGWRAPSSDAAALAPVGMDHLDGQPASASVTWLIASAGEREEDVLQCVEALAVQSNIGPSSVIFLDSGLPTAEAVARRLFRGRVQTEARAERAVRMIQTRLAAYLDASVILHDRRTAHLLSLALQDPAVATASAALVSVDTRGKGALVLPAHLGAIEGVNSSFGQRELETVASALWRTVWPSAAPPPFLWMARTVTLQEWFGSARDRPTDQLHLCSFELSATVGKAAAGRKPRLSPPRADSSALRCELLL